MKIMRNLRTIFAVLVAVLMVTCGLTAVVLVPVVAVVWLANTAPNVLRGVVVLCSIVLWGALTLAPLAKEDRDQ